MLKNSYYWRTAGPVSRKSLRRVRLLVASLTFCGWDQGNNLSWVGWGKKHVGVCNLSHTAVRGLLSRRVPHVDTTLSGKLKDRWMLQRLFCVTGQVCVEVQQCLLSSSVNLPYKDVFAQVLMGNMGHRL